jgi:hypothetical protein
MWLQLEFTELKCVSPQTHQYQNFCFGNSCSLDKKTFYMYIRVWPHAGNYERKVALRKIMTVVTEY